MNLTYAQLEKTIANMSPAEKNLNVSIYFKDQDEYYPIKNVNKVARTDVLDSGHPVLIA